MTNEEAIKRLEKLKAIYSGMDIKSDIEALDMAISALSAEPKYCDRNICLQNDYNGIGCNECEVTKSTEPKTAEWIPWTDDRKDYFKCSECGYGEEGEVKLGEETPYCPNCGAKMKGDTE